MRSVTKIASIVPFSVLLFLFAIVVLGIPKDCFAQASGLQPKQADSAVIAAQGDITRSTVIQLRGRNVADDWAQIIMRLSPSSMRTVEVRAQPNQGLCQIYVSELGLPGCSPAVIGVARLYNPDAGETLELDQPIKVPVLPLRPTYWTILLDRELPDDTAKLKDLEARWSGEIVKRDDRGSQTRLFLKAYDVYLPSDDESGPTVKIRPKFDHGPKDISKIPKILRFDPLGKILKFSTSNKLHMYLMSCSGSTPTERKQFSYAQLLGETDIPDCAKQCAGNCPEINLFDTGVNLHPDIRAAVIDGGVSSGGAAVGSPTRCSTVDFDESKHHGTMLASIMVGQDNSTSNFVGLSPRARLRPIDESNTLSQKRWAQQLQELAIKTWDTPELFVFASQFQYPQEFIENGSLKSEDLRLLHPDVVPVIQDNKLIWITAAGQNNTSEGHELVPIRPESPMNLGDQKTIIVVTSCEVCIGKDAKLWKNANYSKQRYGLVNLAAPGGSAADPIPAAASDSQYSEAYGTSQATAFAAGVAGAMLTCYPDKYKSDGRFIKTRLQITADPMPNRDDAERVTGGIINIRRALLDPAESWLDRGDGPERIRDVQWCSKYLQLRDVETGELLPRMPFEPTDRRTWRLASIIRFHQSQNQKAQWQISNADPIAANVQWSGPGEWQDGSPILRGIVGDGSGSKTILVSGQDIFSFVPSAKFHEMGVVDCATPQ